MEKWIPMVLTVLLLISISCQMLQTRQIRAFTKQIRLKRKEKSQKEIMVELPGRANAQLAAEINGLFVEMHESEVLYQRKEEEQRKMITNISHDIRTPLTSISGYFQMLTETEDDAQRARYSRIIRSRLQSLQELLEEFFAYSKIHGQDASQDADLCDIRQLLSEAMFFFYDEIDAMSERRIELPQERLMVYAREEDLRRIFQNVLKNAICHGGSRIRICMERRETNAVICVENETQEKLPETLSLVFERFFCADEARSTQSSGLGLCIVKELVEKMDGKAEAYLPQEHWFGIRLQLPLCI